jgi:hypothetical protein
MSTGDFTLNVAPEILTALFTGAVVAVSEFPWNRPIPGIKNTRAEPPGTYFVDSVILYADRHVELGISREDTREHLDFYDIRSLRIRVISEGVFSQGLT